MANKNIEQIIKQKNEEIKQLKAAVSLLEKRIRQIDIKLSRALNMSRRNENEINQLQTTIRRSS